MKYGIDVKTVDEWYANEGLSEWVSNWVSLNAILTM